MKSLLVFAAALAALPAPAANVDVAPFGKKIASPDSVGVEWGEMRRIARVEVVFPEGAAPPPPEKMKVEYWRRVWDGRAIRRYVEQGAGGVGWAAMDDWYNGEWKTADVRARSAGRTVVFTFAPSHEKEFSNLQQRGPTYRATLKLRVSLPSAAKAPELRTFSDATWQTSNLVIRFEKRTACDDPLEIYNGSLVSKTAAPAPGGCALRAAVRYAFNPEDADTDRTIVTVRSAANPFSFAVDEAERGDRIYVKDFGVLVTRASDPITIQEHRHILEESGAKTIYDRVAAHPEQTLKRAWADMPLKEPYYFILGCEGGRQRFRVHPNGDLQMAWPSHPQKKGPNNTGLLWPNGLRLRFGLPETRFQDQFRADGYLPILTTRWIEGDLLYEQEALATTLAGDIDTAPPMQADDPVVALVRFRVVNQSPEPRKAALKLSTEAQARGERSPRVVEELTSEGSRVFGVYEGRPALRYIIDTRGAGRLAGAGAGLAYEIELAGRQEHTFFIKAPFRTPVSEEEIGRLNALDFAAQREKTANFWRRRVAAGSRIRTPEPWLNDFYKAALTHLLINSEREVGSDRYCARVGSLSYGAYGNESIMMISDLDRRGCWKEAERALELFLHYQGTVKLPGMFASTKGMLYGAGGYEAGGYNQHHGWILWGLAEHWRYTRDRAWMERNASKLVDACRWIAEERKATKKLDAQGQRVPEYGLLPAGSLEDVTDFWFWLSTNSFTWWGLDNAAAALKDFGHPEASSLAEEAESYRRDVFSAYREAAVRSPVVRLRDGAYVPKFPSNVYTRGRAYGWLRETLEGAIMLPITRLLDPASREAEWIMKDFEDNLYISDRFGYSVPVFDRFWFSRGGFSMQPNLLHGPLPYFYRDDIKQFVRAYFNPFAAGFDPGLRLLPEHPLPELGYLGGQHFKTSDESQSAYWLRLMFLAELDGALHLGRGIPRYWLKDGETIGIENASTYFGNVGYQMKSGGGRIAMTLEPPARNAPKQIVVRFRHAEEKPMRAVTVNGARWTGFDPVKGDIRLPGDLKGKTEIVAEY
ncbi:MAG: hypothetical protein AAB225_10920 [Acidobacteriota bacterium]